MHHGVGSEIHQLIPIVKSLHFYVRRKNFRIQFIDFILDTSQYFARILAFAHHHNTFHHIVIVVQARLTNAGHCSFTHISQILDQNRITICIFDNHILNILFGFYQPNPTHYKCLSVFFDNIATNVQISFVYSIVHINRRHIVARKSVRVNTYFIHFIFTSKRLQIGNSRNGAQLTVNHPILDGKQFARIAFITFQRIAKYFTCRTIRRLHVGINSIG